jgi:Na+-translocating ferredoxin:NAD+ oxidoreductase RnfC subunit
MSKKNYKIGLTSRVLSKKLLTNKNIFMADKPESVFIPLYKNSKTLNCLFEVDDKVEKGDVIAKIEKDNIYITTPVSGLVKTITESKMIDGEYAFVVEIKNNKLYGGADPRREGVALSDLTDKNATIKF